MRIGSLEAAVAGIASGHSVFVHGGAATPTPLLEALAARAPELRDVDVIHLHTEGPAPHLAPALAGHLRHKALFIGANARAAVAEGRAAYVPVFLSDVPHLFDRGVLRADVALITVTPPDRHGFCSLGPSVDVAVAAVRAARSVVALLDDAMPRTHGDGFIHVSRIDHAVQMSMPPHVVASPAVGDVERRIGERIAALVTDGATIQLGIGAIPTAAAQALVHHRDLGVHTEMFSDVVVDLIERGVVTGARKEVNRGKVVSAFVMGTERLYAFVDDNPLIEMRPADYTNDSAVIRRFRGMTAINSAVEVDLSGQVCADSIGYRMLSGVGGQMDFVRGASLAPDGRAITALPSTAGDGRFSRIVSCLRPGAGVVTTRAHVETVVTEHGVADLVGRTIPERARALIALADPAFRETLEREAHAAGIL